MAKMSDDCPAEPLDAEHPLFILYTTGTTGKPKGVVHTTGGYMTGTYITTKWVFDLKDDDTYWCTADIGWVTGHSYVVYGPLAERRNDVDVRRRAEYPEPDRFWEIIERHRVNIFYTAPDGDPRFHQVGRRMAGEARSVEPAPAGHGRRADQSRSLDVVSQTHRQRPLPDRGYLVANRNRRDHDHADARRDPDQARLGDAAVARRRRRGRRSSGQTRRHESRRLSRHQAALASDAAHHLRRSRALQEAVLEQIPGMYFTGDGARQDEDGYFWIMGRIDDVINVSGHRLGTMEVESALVTHPTVAEAPWSAGPTNSKARASSLSSRWQPATKPQPELKDELRRSGRERNRRSRQARRHPLHRRAAQNPQRQNHAAPVARAGRGQGNRRRYDDAGRLFGAGEVEEKRKK